MAEDFDPNLAATVYGSGPAQPARTLGAGDSFAGRYEVLRQLGAGGMGLVYLVRDTVTGEEIAHELEVSRNTIVRELTMARAWLKARSTWLSFRPSSWAEELPARKTR